MFKPLSNQVIIKELEKKEEKLGALILPETVTGGTKTLTGKVVASGPGLVSSLGTLAPNVTKEGNIVIFNSYTHKLKHEGEEFYITRESEILAIVE